ncbi:isochorismate synthase [Vagococcus penaei]|uniref:isochorismate synthase n=1 Tax=Vagococcus penaei TaxID=633807 RepID=A0A1Q2D5R9_9ENTE|nr:isochorismate synthase [Vagococcus penaei]AQP53712.1 hypothetical protein BW732_05300 [Vagococcus penaei]
MEVTELDKVKALLEDGQDYVSLVVSESKQSLTPLAYFQGSDTHNIPERWYFETPDRQSAYAGFGSVKTLTGGDAQADAIRLWGQKQRVVTIPIEHQPVAMPQLVGALSFMPYAEEDEIWGELSRGYFFVPSIQVMQLADKLINVINFSQEDKLSLDQVAQERLALLHKLEQTAQHFVNQTVTVINEREVGVTDWLELVERGVSTIKSHEGLDKVVVARTLELETAEILSIPTVVTQLREQQPNIYVFALTYGTKGFVGATPERLLKATDETFMTASVAGSTPRGVTQEEDSRLGQQLLNDMKNRGEHRIVVDRIVADLENLSGTPIQLAKPSLLKNRDIQHLFLPIEASRATDTSLLDGIIALHPTPALGGEPKDKALAFLAQYEPFQRGLYGAPIGWYGLGQDIGEFVVGIRSALIDGEKSVLYAGCGIVAESEPELERQETRVKFQPMRRGIGGMEQ